MNNISWQGSHYFSEQEFSDLIARATCVKTSPVREVLKSGKYFIKHDFRARVDFKKEFDNARYLEELGVPVVKHVAYGRSASGAYLVTEALEGAVELGDFCRNRIPESSFMLKLVSFVRNLQRVKLRHRDLHTGNVLYVPNSAVFSLVDVRAVKRNRFWHPYRKEEFFELLAGVRDNLPENEMIHYLELAGCRDAKKYLADEDKRKLKALKLIRQRRRKQILSGYPKFTRCEGNLIIDRYTTDEELKNAVAEDAAQEEFLAGYYLNILHLPNGRILGYDLSNAKILLPAEPGYQPAPPEKVAGFLPRFKRLGIVCQAEDFRLTADGRVVFVNLKLAAGSLW